MEQHDPTIEAEIERTAALVEDTIRALGLDPEPVRMPAPRPRRAWSIMRGSAALAIFLRPPDQGEDSPWLRVVSPIIRVDPEHAHALYRELLELNATGLGPLAFGLHHGRVVIVAERPTSGLGAGEVKYLLDRVGATADYYDDALIARFGGTRVSDLT